LGNNILDSVGKSRFTLRPRETAWAGGIKVRLHDDVRKIVVFLGWRTTGTDGQTIPKFGGTGFFVSVRCEIPEVSFTYLVTCKHVAEAVEVLRTPFVIGFNDASGKMELKDIDDVRWYCHQDDNVDIALTPLGLQGVDIQHFPVEGFSENSPFSKNVGTGDLVYIVGLYRLFPGIERLSPVVHTGHVAMTPADEIPIKNPRTGERTATRGYLIEAQTLDGLSGSPVFIRHTNAVPFLNSFGSVVGYTDQVYLLGIWQGAWPGKAGEILTEQIGSDARVPVGMGISIPSQKIMEILENDEVKSRRNELIDKFRSQNPLDMG
jgi:hypothetical protein